MNAIGDCLREHRFQALFTDLLGWEDASGHVTLSVAGRHFALAAIAQKRGLPVLCATTDPVVLTNRYLLRQLQEAVVRSVREHILVFCCDEPRAQVWQWALHLADGRRLRHREYLFSSNAPPVPFLNRLAGLRFPRDEAANATPVEALEHVRQVLDTSAELHLLARHSEYAQRSDELARAMQQGDVTAFHRFVEFHMPLARKISRRYGGRFGLLREDVEQLAFLGLVQAARKFRPELGYQFSRFAAHWIKQTCLRSTPQFALPIHVPDSVFWPCWRLCRTLERTEGAVSKAGRRRYLAELERRDPKMVRAFRAFERILQIRSLSEPTQPAYRAARRLVAKGVGPAEYEAQAQRREILHKALARLDKRQAFLIRLRYGLDGPEHTLEAIARIIQRSKQRVCQILERALRRLHWLLDGP